MSPTAGVSTDPAEVQRYFDLLFPDPPPDASVVVSWPEQKRLESRWNNFSGWLSNARLPEFCRRLARKAARCNIYIGVGLRHPDCKPDPHTRGSSVDIYALPGLWVELDHSAGVHAANNLPTPDELLEFIAELPCKFSLLIDSGGGIHAYALFKELWLLDTPEEQQDAALLLRRFQRTIKTHAAAHGWTVDSTADLARILRPAGTLNHKSGTPKAVTILHEDAIRYNQSDIADAPWLADIEDTYTPPQSGRGDFPPTQLEPIMEGCAWLRHCRDDAATLPETEWYGMLGIVGRCVHGEQIAHEWSTPYPRYSKDETAQKLRHALADAGPRTCTTIRLDLGGDPYCRDCQHWGKVKSPVVLGMPTRSQKDQNADDRLPWSDYSNALALVRDQGQNIRYCYAWKSWLVWTGTHWQRDSSGAVMQCAKETVKRLARHAETLDDVPAKTLMTHVRASLSTAKLKAMVESARDEQGIPVQPEKFDQAPWLLNCKSGTLDLRTGTPRPQAREDLLSKCLPVAYDPEAPCPTWERFLWRIMGGSQGKDTAEMSMAELAARHQADDRARALIGFLQRAIGYSLTGDTREQCLFILHGPTKTGKSTFLSALRHLLGPYGQQADMSTFLHKERDEVRNDLADLAGSRLVCALESQEGRRLSEALIKQITGGVDRLKARFLFQEYFEYTPQFKVFLGTNHKPVIRDSDSAIWERIRLVPFVVQIPPQERDKTLDDRLRQEIPGILAWAVRGCLEWQRLGALGEPDAVTEATASYREEQDTLGAFLAECCIISPQVRVRAGDLYAAYTKWCVARREEPLTLTAFGNRLEERGFSCKRSGGIWRLGIGLRDETQM
jgi:putative DNA primase/helicase